MASERVDNSTPTAERHGHTGVQPSQSGASQAGDLSAAFASVSRRTLRYEHQIKDLEGKLTVNMSNSRAINNLLQEVLSALHQSQRRADVALNTTVPHIEQSLAEDLDALSYLDEHLPRVQQQVHDIRHIYDRGRDKARELITELEWLNTPLSARLRTIIFTSNAPVSSRWKAFIRTLFALALFMCIWISWITLRGAVRAHRQRLVWGERLMS
ncbi:hypothetical protein EVJ58_g6072 [Rhodofomes roseus]|uniref:Uncharacterized protein n=1 Tax=Rhodofomes roseus TaxID=34475 RepID=A0A4Y9Y8U9_9APHY|nr:hypothetical protein EVJ58_g6072 [Rhodofomes roseus]